MKRILVLVFMVGCATRHQTSAQVDQTEQKQVQVQVANSVDRTTTAPVRIEETVETWQEPAQQPAGSERKQPATSPSVPAKPVLHERRVTVTELAPVDHTASHVVAVEQVQQQKQSEAKTEEKSSSKPSGCLALGFGGTIALGLAGYVLYRLRKKVPL